MKDFLSAISAVVVIYFGSVKLFVPVTTFNIES